MKKILHFFLVLPLAMSLIASCSYDDSSEGGGGGTEVVDYGVNYATIRTMVEMGGPQSSAYGEYGSTIASIVVQMLMAADSYGIQVCSDPTFSKDTKFFKTNSNQQGYITVTATDLAPSRTYYYRTYIRVVDNYTYGSTKQFATGNAGMLKMTADFVADFSGGQVTVNYAKAKSAAVTVAYSQNKSDLEGDHFLYATFSERVMYMPEHGKDLLNSESVTVNVAGLEPDKTYYMRPVLICGDAYIGGDIFSCKPNNIMDYVKVIAKDKGGSIYISVKSEIDKVLPDKRVDFICYSFGDKDDQYNLEYDENNGLYECYVEKIHWPLDPYAALNARLLAGLQSEYGFDYSQYPEWALDLIYEQQRRHEEEVNTRVNVEVYAEIDRGEKRWLIYSGDGRDN